MSYCRFSSDNFLCELYCYADTSGGWTTHVAANRVAGFIPLLDESLLDTNPGAYAVQLQAQCDFVIAADRVPIGLPYDGETFYDQTLEAFRARIVTLREAGYRCPDYVLAQIDAELAGKGEYGLTP